MAEQFHVKVRDYHGKRRNRRARQAGQIPAILYGHGKKCVSLSVPAEEVSTALRHGSRVVELQGDVKESAFIREVQWDAFGLEVLHLDLTRVKAGEVVDVTVLIETRGEAPGTREGGVVEQPLHDVELECPVRSIPEKLEVNINELALGDSITLAQLELPKGAKIKGDADLVVVQCVEAAVEEEEEMVPKEAAEPEVIGRKSEDEESSE